MWHHIDDRNLCQDLRKNCAIRGNGIVESLESTEESTFTSLSSEYLHLSRELSHLLELVGSSLTLIFNEKSSEERI